MVVRRRASGSPVMEEIQIADGKIRNPSFTDYLIPTILDMPPMNVDVLELADPHAPYGLRGVGGHRPSPRHRPSWRRSARATGLALNPCPGPARAHHGPVTWH